VCSSDLFAGGAVRAWYAGADSPYNYSIGYVGGANGHFPADHEWGVSLQASLGDNLNGYVGYSETSGNDDISRISYDAWDASIGLVWAPVTGLTIQTEYNFGGSEHSTSPGSVLNSNGAFNRINRQSAEIDRGSFIVRVTRSW